MSNSERARVGQTLDVIRDALATCVDEAMTKAYGDAWNDLVAEEDAARHRKVRKFHVAKNDLAVILKSIIYRRIEPWSGLRTQPRIRSLASELLSLRNLHAHGDECIGEHARLIDTGSRLLTLLDLPVPAALETSNGLADNAAVVESLDVAPRPQTALSPMGEDVAELGEAGEELLAIVARALDITGELNRAFSEGLHALGNIERDFGEFVSQYMDGVARVGAEVVDLLSRVRDIAVAQIEPHDPDLDVLIFFVRCELLTPPLDSAAEMHRLGLEREWLDQFDDLAGRVPALVKAAEAGDESAISELDDLGSEARQRIDEVKQLLEFGHTHERRWRSLVQLASDLREPHPFANLMVARGCFVLALAAKDPAAEAGWSGEALPLLRDGIVRVRFEAARKPGSSMETALVRLLRYEGEICSDLGMTEDAIRAFARADEIVDRYPASDPSVYG